VGGGERDWEMERRRDRDGREICRGGWALKLEGGICQDEGGQLPARGTMKIFSIRQTLEWTFDQRDITDDEGS